MDRRACAAACRCWRCLRGASTAPLVVLDDARNPRIVDADAQRAGGGSAHRHDAGRGVRGRASHRRPAARCGARARAHAAPGRHRRHVHTAGVHRSSRWSAARDQAEHPLVRRPARVVPPAARRPASRMPAFARSGAQPHFTLAPTALAALAAARAGARCFITDPRQLPARLKPLPLAALRWPEEDNARLLGHGRAHARRALRLPRAGFAKRFGAARLADLDRLLGRRADPRRRLARRERYAGRLDLDHEIEDHDRILEALRPLLDELEQFLRSAAARHHRVAMPFPSLPRGAHHVRAAAGRARGECRAAAVAAA